ncbi:MAG: tetratricopeptide repeat protein [Thermoanaerobaculia bacterium]
MKAEKRQELIIQAEKLFSRGKLEGALSRYRKILKAHPNDTSTLKRVGDVFERLNRVDEAITLYKKTAQHFTNEGFYAKAIAIYKKIIRLDPTLIEAIENLADLQHRQGLTREAVSQYEVVAEYYLKLRDLNSVIEIHKKMVELEPGDPSRRLKLAELHQKRGRLKDALEQYRAISKMMLSSGRIGEASRVCLRALEIDPSDLNFVAGAVEDLKSAGHPEEADRLISAAIDLNPEARNLQARIEEAAEEEDFDLESFMEGEEPAAAVADTGPLPGSESADAIEVAIAAAAAEVDEASTAPPDTESVEAGIEDALDVLSADEVEELADAAVAVTESPVEEVEIEIDLGDFEQEPIKTPPPVAPAAAPETAMAMASAEPATQVANSLPMKRAVPIVEADPEPGERLRELLTEADVLSRYGLDDKAVEKLEELLAEEPDNLEAMSRLITLKLEAKDLSGVTELANQLVTVAQEKDESEAWQRVRDQILGEGFTVEDGRVVAPTEELAIEAEEESLVLAEDLDLGDADLSWLEEEPPAGEDQAPPAEALFEAEDEFFDLASELEAELRREEIINGEELLLPGEEESIEDIVEGFKKGMAETLSDEDFDTHYNLGIAYREMGLIDEAIGEFQLAAKDQRYLVECCSLLALCFKEKGFPELAIKWYQRGLDSPSISEDETLGLVYELGDLYLEIGNKEAARERFVEIYGVNSTYRDVVAKLQELGGS